MKFLLAATSLSLTLLASSQAIEYWAYFGCIGDEAPGIYVGKFDSETGKLSEPKRTVSPVSASFLTISPNGETLYAVEKLNSERDNSSGGLGGYQIDATTGDLTPINRVNIDSVGACHVALTPTGQTAATADYGSGIVASFAVAEDGTLSERVTLIQHEGSSINEQRQNGPHAHCVTPSLDGRYIFSADLGTDHVYSYAVGKEGAITPNPEYPSVKIEAGGGPRHMTFHPSHMFAFVNSELTSSVNAFRYHSEGGQLTPVHTISTLPADWEGEKNSTSEILCHPTGRWLYVANRGHNSIAAFSVDGATGELTPINHEPCGGEIPRNFGITPDGNWIITCCQDSGNAAILKINNESGALSLTKARHSLPKPMCVRFVPVAKNP